MQTNYKLASTQALTNKRNFIPGVIIPLSAGVSLYALSATTVMVYDILLKVFA